MNNKVVSRLLGFIILLSIFAFNFSFHNANGVLEPTGVESSSNPLPLISLKPVEYTTRVGESFTIDVNITNVEDLGCFEFKLGYNTTLLDATYVKETSVTSICIHWLPVDENMTFHPDGPLTIDETTGRVWVGALFPGGQEFTGNGTLVRISFTATGVGNCTLNLYDTGLGDQLGNPIDHTTLDSSITVRANAADVNDDGSVNVLDVKLVKLAYSGFISPPDPEWYRAAALAEPDDAVNILDVKNIKLIYSCVQ